MVPGATQTSLRMLDTIQRIGSQAVIGRFSTVARCVAESEAGIELVNSRHHNQQRNAWIKWNTKPQSHRFWKVQNALCTSNKRWISSLQKIAQTFVDLDLTNIDKIGAYTRDPSTSVELRGFS